MWVCKWLMPADFNGKCKICNFYTWWWFRVSNWCCPWMVLGSIPDQGIKISQATKPKKKKKIHKSLPTRIQNLRERKIRSKCLDLNWKWKCQHDSGKIMNSCFLFTSYKQSTTSLSFFKKIMLSLFFFFWCGPFLKFLLDLLQYCVCFMFWHLTMKHTGF